jgi:hypothetical protein
MINYGDLVHRLILKTDTNEDVSSFMDEISKLEKKDLFIFLKSMAVLIVNLQNDLKELKKKQS